MKIVKHISLLLLASLPCLGMAQTDSLLQQIVDSNQGILDKNDISRKEHAQALINYQAESALKNYQMEEQKMYMAAPGSLGAIDAGVKAAKDATSTTTQQVIGAALKSNFPVQNAAQGPTSSLQGSLSTVEKLKPYLDSGDPKDLKGLNTSTLLQEDSLDPGTINQLVGLLTQISPVPLSVTRDPATNELALTGEEIKSLGDRADQAAMMSLAIGALSELGARRVANPDTNTSLEQIIKNESTRRFTSTEWYTNIGISSQEALLREIAQMMAFQMAMDYQNFRMQEQTVSLLAALVTAQAKLQTTIKALTEAMDKASKSASDAASKLPEDLSNINIDAGQ